MEMDEIIFALKETVRELNPGVLFVQKYGGELIELIPNNEKSRIGGIFTYSAHVTLEFSHGFKMDLGPCLLYTSPSPRDRTRSRMPSSA